MGNLHDIVGDIYKINIFQTPLQIRKSFSCNLCGLEEGINNLLTLPLHIRITKVQIVHHPLLVIPLTPYSL
jgi:hypothetical protein